LQRREQPKSRDYSTKGPTEGCGVGTRANGVAIAWDEFGMKPTLTKMGNHSQRGPVRRSHNLVMRPQTEFENVALAELDPTYRYARCLTGNAAAAEALVERVFTRAFAPESIARFSTGGVDARAWLIAQAREIYFEHSGDARAGMPTEPLASGCSPAMAADSDEALTASECEDVERSIAVGRGAGAGEGKMLVRRALDRLSAESRDVLWLWAVEGLAHEAIAQALNVTIATATGRLHRARGQIERLLGGTDPGMPHRSP